MPELGISPEKVCAIVEVAREVAGLEPSPVGDDDDAAAEGDDSPLTAMLEPPNSADPRRRELVAFVAGLNAEEQMNLLALIALGRGDFAIAEWDDALAAARDGIADRSADFLIGDPALAEYLLEALEAFGESCSG
jgi:Protein of unknown function (DUF3775)